MRFKDRKALANEYKEWLKKTIENNQVMVLDCPESVIAFVDIKGYLQEEKRAEWIVLYDEDSPQDGIWKCSNCGYIRFVDDVTPSNYCPNCGARMDKQKARKEREVNK